MNDTLPDPMARALTLAERGLWLTQPNPRVGCVIIGPDGRLLGEGEQECPQCGARALPLALCRTCGWDFFISVGPQNENGLVATLTPWPARRSTPRTRRPQPPAATW